MICIVWVLRVSSGFHGFIIFSGLLSFICEEKMSMEGQEGSSSGVPSRVMKFQRTSPLQLGMITPNQFEVSAAVATPPITAVHHSI